MRDDPRPRKILPDLLLVIPGHTFPAYAIRYFTHERSNVGCRGEIEGIFTQHLPVEVIVMSRNQRLAGHGLQQRWVGASRAMTVKVETRKELQVMNPLLIVNDSAKKNPLVTGELQDIF